MSETFTHHESVDHLCSQCGFVFECGLQFVPCPACGNVDLTATTLQEALGRVSLMTRKLANTVAHNLGESMKAANTMEAFVGAVEIVKRSERTAYLASPWYRRLAIDLERDVTTAAHYVEYQFAKHITRHVLADLYNAKLWVVNTIIRLWPEEFAHEITVRIALRNNSSRNETVLDVGTGKTFSAPGVNVDVSLVHSRKVMIVVDPWVIAKKEELSRRGY